MFVNEYPRFGALRLIARQLSLWLAGVVGYSVLVIFLLQWYEFHPQPWETAGALVNGLILGVLMAFRNRAAYDRWWEGRKLWGQLINETRNFAWKVSGYLPAETIARGRFAEALAGFAEALKQHLRGGVRLQEIAGFENDLESPQHVPSHLAGHLLNQLAAWQREALIDGSTALMLDVHARTLLEVCGGCERIRNTGITPSHKALLRLGIVLNVLIVPWFTFPDLGLWAIPGFVLVCFFLLGIELVDTIIEEPFGLEADDLELDRYCETIRQSVGAILGKSVG